LDRAKQINGSTKQIKIMIHLKEENEMLKRLLKDGVFWMNYSSTDCDGCSSYSAKKYTSLQEFYDAEESCAEWADGSFSFDLAPERADGTYQLNEAWSGGSW
jgi:hypothetical protein